MLLQFLEFLYPAILATVVFAAIHSWLGIRMVERGLVFPSLALAQLAALGTAISLRFGVSAYIGAFAFALAGAALFLVNRRETLVAIVFAASAAGTFLFLGEASVAGDLLSVRVRTIALTAVVYLIAGAAQLFVRGEWLLFVSLAVVLTSSVAIAGVLLVFTYLVAPAVISRRFAIAWPFAILVSVAGILLAFKLDEPTAPTIVCTFAVVLALGASIKAFRKRVASGRLPVARSPQS
ncbi:MAG TPA: metal ABC transporter permease [Thermoanaerobaculia bacterium]